jgi:hypothetical protein
MDVLVKLSAISSSEIPLNERLKAKFMVLVQREYRKFKEIEQLRSLKLEAMDQLKTMTVVHEAPTAAEGHTSNSTDHMGMTKS